MSNEIVPFLFEGKDVRVIRDASGDPWFVLADVCRVLEIRNPSMAAARLKDREKNTLSLTEGIRGNPNVTIINHSGLYRLVLRSDKPQAERFQDWVVEDVIPTIRKTGRYELTPNMPAVDLRDPDTLLPLLAGYAQDKKRLLAQVAILKPKAEIFDRIARADGSLCIMDTAKVLQVRPKELFAHLRSNRWIYRRAGGKYDIAYQDKIQGGLLEHKVATITQPDGSEKVKEQVLVTPKGLAKLAKAFNAPPRPAGLGHPDLFATRGNA